MAQADNSLAIGIDLGTTFSCVAVYRNGGVEIIANNEGDRITPSIVTFRETGMEISMQAKREASMYPKNTVYGIKRLIGRNFTDPIVQKDIKQWPFTVIDVDGEPKIEIEMLPNRKKRLSAVEISSYILKRMKKIAEDYLGHEITKAVITVPAYFTNAQREATRQAGILANLDVLRILNEPTAAGIAYGFQRQITINANTPKKILVFDLGGGTFDVSILAITDNKFTVLGTAGDNHLGGEDVDVNLVKHFIEVVKNRLHEDITEDLRAIANLRNQCELAKKVLTTNTSTKFAIDNLVNNKDFTGTLSRQMFDELNKELYTKLKDPINAALKSAQIQAKEVDDVILVGGSTRIPYIQNMVKEMFNKEPCKDISEDEAVAYGAALLAACLQGNKDPKLNKIFVEDVIPISLGIATAGGKMTAIVKGNTPIPVTESQMFTTNYDDQSTIVFSIYEGERPLIADNSLLGEFTIKDIPSSKREAPKVKVEFCIDVNGILSVSCQQIKTGKSERRIIQADGHKWTAEKLALMRAEVELFREEDENECRRIDAKCEMESFCLTTMKDARKDFNAPRHLRDSLIRLCSDKLSWLDKHQDEPLEEIEDVLLQLKLDCETLKR